MQYKDDLKKELRVMLESDNIVGKRAAEIIYLFNR